MRIEIFPFLLFIPFIFIQKHFGIYIFSLLKILYREQKIYILNFLLLFPILKEEKKLKYTINI